MTPLPPELLEIRGELRAAARRRAARRRPRLLARMRLPSLTLGAFVALGAVAVAAGLLAPARDGHGGDTVTLRLLGGPSAGLQVRCGPSAGGPALCRELRRTARPATAVARALRRHGAAAGVEESGTRCDAHGCRRLRDPRPDAVPPRPGRLTYQRTGTRPGPGPVRSGGYRSVGGVVSWVGVDGAPAVRCARRSPHPVCRGLRAVTAGKPPMLSRLPGRLGARTVVVETAVRCRFGRRYACRAVRPATGRRLSAHPGRLAPGEDASYSRLVVTR